MTAGAWGQRAAAIITAVAVTALAAGVAPRAVRAQADRALRAPDAFASIVDRSQRSIALFVEAGNVFQHPRCQNCHPGMIGPVRARKDGPTSRR